MSRPTLDDIAAQAGVSAATVSRVLNNKCNVSDATRAAVLSATRILGRGMPAGVIVGLIVPDAANPFFSQLGFAFEREFETRGVHVLVSSSEGRADRELALIERFKGLGAQGLIYIAGGGRTQALLSLVAEGTLPVVVFDRRVRAGNVDFVAVNSRHGTLCAVDYLITYGHERIAYLKGLEETETARERYESFCEAMAQNRLRVVPDWVFLGDYTVPAGRACAERLLGIPSDQRPTAILAANDLMAIGLMQRLQQEGWSLPRDLSVIGFDNIAFSEWVHPALTTISQPTQLLVREAANHLMQRIADTTHRNGDRQPPKAVELMPTLVPRASVAEPWTPQAAHHAAAGGRT
jgi:LacI family transcriptional regulator